jgi:HAD superfamily hydrolase (TIGR01662 family)
MPQDARARVRPADERTVTPPGPVPPARNRPIRAVVFDVGETLVDETTEYQAWADWLGVPRHTFSAAFGAVIARGQDHRQVFQIFRPGFDLATERQRRADAGRAEAFTGNDLYPDVRAALAELKAQGFLVGVAGNQTARAGQILRSLGLAADFIATSEDWHAEKPSPEFFAALIAECGLAPEQIAYVGDRLDNDILPALAAGLVTAFLRRGPWGYHYQHDPLVRRSDIRIEALTELPGAIAHHNQAIPAC